MNATKRDPKQPFRSLANYLADKRRREAAERRGVLAAFLQAPTLTEARRLAYGAK